MSDENKVENQDPNVEAQAEDNGGSSQTTPEVEKTKRKEWYEIRQLEKLKKQQQKELEEMQAKIERGEVTPSDTDVEEMLESKDMRIRELEAEGFITNNQAYAPHKEAILEAVANPRYKGLSTDEIARIVAAAPVQEEADRQDAISAHSTGSGHSARGATSAPKTGIPAPGTQEYENYLQRVKLGRV